MEVYPTWLWLRVCHGKIHPFLRTVNHLFLLGPSKNHGYVSHNQRVFVIEHAQMLHGAGIFTIICPNKITQFCRKIYQHHGAYGIWDEENSTIQYYHSILFLFFNGELWILSWIVKPEAPYASVASLSPKKTRVRLFPRAPWKLLKENHREQLGLGR